MAKDMLNEVHQLLIDHVARVDEIEQSIDKLKDASLTRDSLGPMMHGAMSVAEAAMAAKIKEVDDKLAAALQQIDKLTELYQSLLQGMTLAVEAIKAHQGAETERTGVLHLPSGPVKMVITEKKRA